MHPVWVSLPPSSFILSKEPNVSRDHRHISRHLEELLRQHTAEELSRQLTPDTDGLPPKVPGGSRLSADAVESRWQVVPVGGSANREQLLDPQTLAQMETYQGNVENFIGTVKVPVGLAGPLRVNGLYAKGDYCIPLATTEAALVASYSRGCQLLSEVGGCSALLLSESISRAPGFAFASLSECGLFIVWAVSQLDAFRREAEATTQHGKLIDMRVTVEGNHVYLIFEFTTGDAAGQNMVTIATEAICNFIHTNSPVQPRYYFIEANHSGDKKASAQSFLLVRGKKVSAEVTVPADLIKKRLNTTAEQLINYWRMSALGGVLSGTLGTHGHLANGLTALYLACGQDVACVAESAVGVTRFELTEQNDLYACVTMPNLVVGTVGGGTALPSQQACLDILGLAGPGHARALAEVCAGVCLAGELSITAALASGAFGRAHRVLARTKAHRAKREPQQHA
jgi:hydroxymethylglutaryl-CoA reductase (NADPH)